MVGGFTNNQFVQPGGEPLVLCFVDFMSPAHAATAMDALQGEFTIPFQFFLWIIAPICVLAIQLIAYLLDFLIQLMVELHFQKLFCHFARRGTAK